MSYKSEVPLMTKFVELYVFVFFLNDFIRRIDAPIHKTELDRWMMMSNLYR
jgi:hypothetical protein